MSQELEALKALQASVEQMSSDVKKTAEKALEEAKNAGQVSAELKAKIDADASALNADRQKLNALEVQLGEAEKAFASLPTRGQAQAMSVGSTYAADEKWKEFQAGAAQSSRMDSCRIDVKAAVTSLDSGGESWTGSQNLGFVGALQSRLTIRDLLPWVPVDSGSVEYTRETGFTNNANVIEENPTGIKAESELLFESATSPIVTIAHWIRATKQVLSDSKMLAAYINLRMGYGLKQKEESQLLYGSGVGVNINGLATQATAYNNQGITVANETPLDRLRIAMLQVELADLAPEGHVLHPTDWAAIELLKDGQSKYLFANPFGLTVPTLWALPVATTKAQTKGEFLTGAFRQGALGLDREDMSIEVFNQDRDNVVKNMVTILVEERIGLQVLRPEAFVKGALKGTP